MKKPITIPMPKCGRCKKQLEPRFTTEKEEGDNSKPEVIMVFGVCEKCNVITMSNIIKTKDLPNEKEFLELAKSKESGK